MTSRRTAPSRTISRQCACLLCSGCREPTMTGCDAPVCCRGIRLENDRMRTLVLLVLAASAYAQVPNPFYGLSYPELREYLALTDDQLQRIDGANQEYNAWVFAQEERIARVQEELAGETASTALEPLAIGVRYVEIEAICRKVAERRIELAASTNAVLTPAQRTKVEALREAVKLVPVIQQSQSLRLIGGTSIIAGVSIESIVTVSAADRFSRTDGTRIGGVSCSARLAEAVRGL